MSLFSSSVLGCKKEIAMPIKSDLVYIGYIDDENRFDIAKRLQADLKKQDIYLFFEGSSIYSLHVERAQAESARKFIKTYLSSLKGVTLEDREMETRAKNP